ncbi:MAG: tRNA nucleotidyltransferase/poly(A) polymerase family protein, partial [Solirubrobacteraceae bacterium]
RDFTVNAIALGLGGADRGRVIEVQGAREDIERRTLRVLHERSFRDDPTRLLRLARYAARLRFDVEDRTRQLAVDALDEGALRTVSGARLGAELQLLLAESDPVAGLRELRRLRIDAAIAPGFGLADPGLAARAIALLPHDASPGDVAMAVALAGVTPTARRALLDEFSFPARRRDAILAAAQGAPPLARALAAADRPSRIASAVGGASPESVALAGAIGGAPQATRWLQDLRYVTLEIDGDDLLGAGVPAGPDVGRGLAAARAARLDGAASDRDAQLHVALAAIADREG